MFVLSDNQVRSKPTRTQRRRDAGPPPFTQCDRVSVGEEGGLTPEDLATTETNLRHFINLMGMIVGLGALGLALHLPGLSGWLGWLTTGSLMLYVGAFAVGHGPVFWLLISEIYPLKIRGLAMSGATAANWGANLLVALTFLTSFT
jgi:hypothetical protein